MPRPCQASMTTNAISARPGSKTMYLPPADNLAAGFLRERDNRDMIFEVDIHEEGALLLREVALHDEEAALQRLCAGPFDRSEHVGLILRAGARGFRSGCRRGEARAPCSWSPLTLDLTCPANECSRIDRRRPMKPGLARGRLIWIKTIAWERQVAWRQHAHSQMKARALRTLRQHLSGEDVIQLAIRLGLLAFLIYWTFLLIRPFVPILAWSIVLAVALYPVFDFLSRLLGGRPRLAAAILTVVNLAIVIGPATWLGLSALDGMRETRRRSEFW